MPTCDRSERSSLPPPRRRVMLSRHGLVTVHAIIISLVAVGQSAAQNRPEIMAFPPEVTGYMRMGAIFHENFFQLPNDGPRRDVLAGVLELRIEEKLDFDGAFRVYTRGDVFQFQQLGSSPGGLVGVRRARGANQFDLSVTGQWSRPRFDSGDELEQANILAANGSYSLRIVSPLELIALAEYSRESLKLHSERRSRSYEVGGAVRYRALRGRVSAEGGLLQGVREINDVIQQYVNETRYVAVRTTVIPRMYISVRFRNRIRGYTTDDAASRNFGREDRRRQVTAYLDLALWGNLVWNLSGGIDEADSTKPGSAVRSRQFGTTLSVMLPGR
jgi:hypothetical protein